MLQEQMVVNECYILQSRIGEDAYSEHWIATAIFSATQFLLRFIKSNTKAEHLEKLRTESMRCYRVRGPAIADFVEVDFFNGQLFISSEFHGEKTLVSFLEKDEKLRIGQICLNSISLAHGLESFHSQGIVYGNLNAENILMGKAGTHSTYVKIQKPGLLSLLPSLGENEKYQIENYAYIAPEYKLNRELCEGSDVYSLGIHLVRSLTGKLPFPDSVQFIQTNSACLRYVTNALLRRGIPEELVRIILHALMPDPKRRYTTCLDFIADMRYFMESSKIKTPDSNDYFKTLSSPVKTNESESAILYPLNPIASCETVDKIEKKELTSETGEAEWSIDDYIDNGMRAIAGENSSQFFITATKQVTIEPVHIDDALYGKLKQKIIPASATVSETIQPEQIPEPMPEQAPQPDSFPQSESPQHLPAKPVESNTAIPETRHIMASSRTQDKKANWNYHQVQFQDAWKIIEHSAKWAQKSKGSFRYIQEPPSNHQKADLFHSMETLKKDFLYINLGTFARYEKADINDFLMMLRYALARETSGETKKTISYFAQRVKKQDASGFFTSEPLGRLLFGKDSTEKKLLQNSSKANKEAIMRTLFAFSRRKKPLVLIVRGGENIQRDLHELFTIIACGIHEVPVCIVVFFEHTHFESWHTLSKLPQK